MKFQGNWTFFIADSKFIEGVGSSFYNKPSFKANYSQTSYSVLNIQNFSSISRQSQIALYVSLRTPLTAATYPLAMTVFRSGGGIA